MSAGKLDTANSAYVLQCLDQAIAGCLSGEFAAMVTGPVHKGVINDAGIPFTGHTEYLAAAADGARTGASSGATWAQPAASAAPTAIGATALTLRRRRFIRGI